MPTESTDYNSYISSCPCDVCKSKEKCETECKTFDKYVMENNKKLRKINYNNFCELQKMSNSYGVY